MTRELALLCADEVRKAHPEFDTTVVEVNGHWEVKVREGNELVMKFGDK
jgi:hypothetical protein